MRRVASAAERIKGSPPKPPHVDPVAPTLRALPPRWLRGDIEPPAGEETRGTATFSYYTEEQQQRLGVDREGNAVPVVDSDLSALCGDLERVKSEKEAEGGYGQPLPDEDIEIVMKTGFIERDESHCCRMLGLVNGRE